MSSADQTPPGDPVFSPRCSRGPIAAAWFFCVFPALILCYTGQSAYLLGHLSELAPDPAHGPECAAAWYGGVGAACAGGLAGSECCARFTEAQSVIANTFCACWNARESRPPHC